MHLYLGCVYRLGDIVVLSILSIVDIYYVYIWKNEMHTYSEGGVGKIFNNIALNVYRVVIFC